MDIFLIFIAIALIFGFFALDWILNNILWIGGIVIAALVITTIKNIPYYREFGFDFGELLIILLKAGVIAFIIYLICL